MALPDHFEPAFRDPKKLRRTAFMLVGVMIVGGFFVMKAYIRWTGERQADDRPAIVHRIQPERSLRVMRQDGNIADLVDLRGKVFAIHVIDLDQMECSRLSLEALNIMAKRHVKNDQFLIVTLVLNPGPADGLIEKLQRAATLLQAEMPQRWVASTQHETLTKWIRKELKPATPPVEMNGRWEFDPSVVLVDRNGHLRQAVVPLKDTKSGEFVSSHKIRFDFNQASEWDNQGKLSGSDLSNVERLEELMGQTVDKLLAEGYEEKRSTFIPVFLGTAFLLFVLMLVARILRSRKASSA